MVVYLDLDAEAKRLEAAGEHGQLPLRKLRTVMEALKTVVGTLDQWGGLRLCTPACNQSVDGIEIIQSKEECNHEAVEVWPYTTAIQEAKLYSVPPYFVIGHGNPNGFGVIPTGQWGEEMQAAQIPEAIRARVSEFLRRHPPINYDQVPDDRPGN